MQCRQSPGRSFRRAAHSALLAACGLAAVAFSASRAPADEGGARPSPLHYEQQNGKLVITQAGRPVATYIRQEDEIRRPFFANVHAPGGIQVTRHHPPRAGVDPADHATMHPGLWLAFGDLSGRDFWRNRGRVEQEAVLEAPQVTTAGQTSVLRFAVRQRYVAEGQVVAEEIARHAVVATASGYLFIFDSEFSADQGLVFGDQEEMGLGVRVATPIAVKGGTGQILNSHGQRDEKQVWGQPAEWCDYSGLVPADDPGKAAQPAAIGRRRAGLLLVPHPENFRRSWMHARDYGLLVANAFG